MTTDQWSVWLLATLNIPFITLLILLFGLWMAILSAHRGGKLDFAQMFKDEAGKESGARFAIVGAWVMSSWYLMADLVITKSANVWLYGLYLLFWASTPTAMRLIEKWDGKVPTKGNP